MKHNSTYFFIFYYLIWTLAGFEFNNFAAYNIIFALGLFPPKQ